MLSQRSNVLAERLEQGARDLAAFAASLSPAQWETRVPKDGRAVGVIVSDSFGRPFRQGTTDVAIGVAGIRPLLDLRGTADARGYELRSTQIAVADEIAGAAELVLGKSRGIPAARVRGVDVQGDGSAAELVMPRERDLFR